MTYPTLEQVDDAEHIELARWHRFLKSPTDESQSIVLDRISLRFKDLGGWTPSLSKAIGWED